MEDNFDFGNFESEMEGLGSFETTNDDVKEDDKNGILKTSVVIIVVGALLIFGAFILMRVLRGNDGNSKSITDAPVVERTVTNTGWSRFTPDNKLAFEAELVESIFSVVEVRNYVKVTETGNNLKVKSVVTGNLTGFTGTYELELGLDKGMLLLPGNSFRVNVQVGSYNGRKVVGKIFY